MDKDVEAVHVEDLRGRLISNLQRTEIELACEREAINGTRFQQSFWCYNDYFDEDDG